MCGWIIAILVVPHKITPVGTPWHSDLSGLPISKRRAYGRLLTTPFECKTATIKQLKPIQFIDSNGVIVDQTQVFALTLNNDNGSSVIVYFIQKSNDAPTHVDYRRRPNEIPKKDLKQSGITSLQLIAQDLKTGKFVSKMFRQSFSTRLVLGRTLNGQIIGSIIAVFPDNHRSFVSGCFKANIIASEIK